MSPPAVVPLRSVALPAEHGGWGLVAEPLVVGLAVAPSWAAAGIVLAFLGGFLLHHPLKLVLADARRGTTYPRTRAAAGMAGLYAAVAATGLALAAATAEGPFWLPLLVAAPVALVQLGFDARNRSRHVVAELAGAVALAAGAASPMLAAGWSLASAAAVWSVLAGRGVASVLYVRARLRRDRQQPAGLAAPLSTHLALVAGSLALVAEGLLPVAGLLAGLLLLARAAWGLSSWHPLVRPQVVGFQELGWGIVTAVLLVVGYRL